MNKRMQDVERRPEWKLSEAASREKLKEFVLNGLGGRIAGRVNNSIFREYDKDYAFIFFVNFIQLPPEDFKVSACLLFSMKVH